jgi:peptide/nickel transport system substrate-binding protein
MGPDKDLQRLLFAVSGRSVNRRELLKRGAAIGLGTSALAAALSDVSGARRADAAALNALLQQTPPDFSKGIKGGILKVANIGEPPTLDVHTTTTIASVIGFCNFEALFTYDSKYNSVPDLAESHSVSADGLTQTIKLRQNVPFHNGEIMKADDVIASITRWASFSGVGKKLLEATNEVAKVDDYTIEFRLKEPYGTIPIALSHNSQSCVILPKSVLDKVGDKTISDNSMLIGTGPYKLQEWKPDAYIRYVRFDDYKAREDPVDGYAGKKYAFADQIDFIPVPDEAARVAGLQAGDYHLAVDIGNDQYETLKDSQGVVAEILPPSNWDVYFCNWKSPLMSKLPMRQALQALFDMKPMLISGRGGESFIQLEASLMKKGTPFYTEAGSEYYDMKNPDLAKQKLQEAGYDGEPIRFMTTQEYSYMYGAAVVAKQQMESIGMKIDFRVTDWATVLENRAKPDAWDMFITGHGYVPDPSQITYIGQMNIYPGWWDDPGSLKLAADLLAESDQTKRVQTWEQLQTNAYTQIPALKIGDSSTCSFRSDKVGGWVDQIDRGIPYWNLWINQ